jgi:hypothetical protein
MYFRYIHCGHVPDGESGWVDVIKMAGGFFDFASD